MRRRGRWLLNVRPFGPRPDLVVRLGRGSDRPVVGDWDGDGQDTLGVVRNGRWVLHDDLRARGRAEHDFRFGRPTDVPAVGAWKRRRPDRPGFVRGGVWYLRATLGSGGSVRKVRFGRAGDWFVTPGGVGLDHAWDRLAACESGGRWSIATGNGYYGGLQFSLRSWRAVGANGYPHQAPRRRQIHYGQRLRRLQGWGAWPVCSRKTRLR
ncbi:MAG: transglycosylase family protein [Egibacteraceae bacterium]